MSDPPPFTDPFPGQGNPLDEAELVLLRLLEDRADRPLESLCEALEALVRGGLEHDAVLEDCHAPLLILGPVLPTVLLDDVDTSRRDGELLDLPRALDGEAVPPKRLLDARDVVAHLAHWTEPHLAEHEDERVLALLVI